MTMIHMKSNIRKVQMSKKYKYERQDKIHKHEQLSKRKVEGNLIRTKYVGGKNVTMTQCSRT